MRHENIVYALQCDASNWVYVGKSCRGLTRPKEHIRSFHYTKCADIPVYRWVAKRFYNNETINIVILETFCSEQQLSEAEIFYIAYFRSIGMLLLNCTSGGEGASDPSQETRAKMSASKKGIPLKLEHREKLLRAHKEYYKTHKLIISDTAKAKMSLAKKGKKLSSEHCTKLSIAHSGKKHSDVTKKKMSAWQQGRKRPEMIGANNPRAKLTPEQVGEIKKLLNSSSLTQAEIGYRFGISVVTVGRINTGRVWREVE